MAPESVKKRAPDCPRKKLLFLIVARMRKRSGGKPDKNAAIRMATKPAKPLAAILNQR